MSTAPRPLAALLVLFALLVSSTGAAPAMDADVQPRAAPAMDADVQPRAAPAMDADVQPRDAPTWAADVLDAGVDSHDHELVRCGNGGFGALVNDGSGHRGACVEVTYGLPPGWFPQPVFPETTACPTGQHGMNATWLNTTAAVCYTLEGRLPGTLACQSITTCVRVSITDCEPTYNVDPAVYVSDGGIVACAFVYHESPARPDIDGDLSPCEGGFDPVIYVNDAYVRVCVWVLA